MALDVNRAEKPVRKLRKLLKKMPAMPGADDIHDFRTSSRRIEATLQALSLDSGHNCRRILKQISRLRKRAGKVRDMDVPTDYLSSLPRHEKEKEYSVQLLRFAAEEPKGYSTGTADGAPIVRTPRPFAIKSGVAAGAGALRRFRPDARDRALGQRRRAHACRDAAIVDDIELMEVCVLRYSYIHYHVSVSRSIC